MAVRSNQHPKATHHGMWTKKTKLPVWVASSLALAVVFALGLAGCHSFKPLTPQPAAAIPSLLDASLETTGVASVHCSGGIGCQFLALNGIQLLSAASGEPTEHGKNDAILRFESPTASDSSQYYLALSAAPHDIDVQFYPISRTKPEYFAVTHRFKAGHRYDLNLYRQQREQSGSLMSLAAPAPLCVDVLDNGQLVRRFCRNYDFQAASTSFVEQKIKS